MEPEQLPEFVHDIAEWTRRSGGTLWCGKAAQGSPFYWPPGITDPSKDALALREEVHKRVLRRTGLQETAHAASLAEQQKATIRAYEELAAYHATTLEQAKLLHIGRDISYLAARTEMREYRLDLDLFRLDPKREGSLMTCGFIMWDTPIGEAEPRGQLTAQYDVRSGELIEVDVVADMMEGFRDSSNPVNALSWRILPGAKDVLIIFYTDGAKAREGYRRYIEEQKANLPPGMTYDKAATQHQLSDPQPLEREQVLPLGKTLAWFEQKDTEERLQATILSDPSYLREAERRHVADDFLAANERVLPMLSQMVKTFVATLAIRRMKLAQQEEVAPPRAAVKRMRRAGASTERQEGRVQVIRIGKPLQRRAKSEGGGGGGKWKVKTIIGPVIRTRQYVPAYDEYRDGVWMIEPYVAGPEDAPWSQNAKVFLLGDDSSSPIGQKAEKPSATTKKPQADKGKSAESPRADDLVSFGMQNAAADLIERKLRNYEHNSADAFIAARQRKGGASTFTVTLYAAMSLVVEVGYLLEDVAAGTVDTGDTGSPVATLQDALDSIRAAAAAAERP